MPAMSAPAGTSPVTRKVARRRAVRIVDDPVLGPCKVLPLRTDRVLPFALVLFVMSVSGLFSLWLWVFEPSVQMSVELRLGFALCGIGGPPALLGVTWQLQSPYFAMVGPRGFSAMRFGRIPWGDVVAAGTETIGRGKQARLVILLSRPRRISGMERFMGLGGFGQEGDPALQIVLPLNMAPLPTDDIVAIFKAYLTTYADAQAEDEVTPEEGWDAAPGMPPARTPRTTEPNEESPRFPG